MPLPLEGPRPLSPLELEAFRLVFWDSIDPCDVHVTVTDDSTKSDGAYSPPGHIRLNSYTFPHANLHKNSSSEDPDILAPANIACLSTLIHECVHHWQSVYQKYIDVGPGNTRVDDFSKKELETLKFIREEHPGLKDPEKFDKEYPQLLKEQFASIAQVYLIIAWQLRHSSDPLVNLTTGTGQKSSVGPIARYHEIKERVKPPPYEYPSEVWVSREVAGDIIYYFNPYLVELRSGGRKRWAG